MRPMKQKVQVFDLSRLAPGQTLVVRTHDDVELAVQAPEDAETVVVGDRACLSEVVVRQRVLLTPQRRCQYPSRDVRVGESWQYGQHFYSHEVISITFDPTPNPFAFRY